MGFASLTLFVTRCNVVTRRVGGHSSRWGEGRGVEEKASRGFFPWSDREIGVDSRDDRSWPVNRAKLV